MSTKNDASGLFRIIRPPDSFSIWAWVDKTVITLTAVQTLIYDRFEVSKVLVIAPLRVAEDTWSRESEKWDHLQGLRISKILGTARQRAASLGADADIYVINRENVAWLVQYILESQFPWPFDMVVIDELSSFKN